MKVQEYDRAAWESVELLQKQHMNNHAMAVFKVLVEKTFTLFKQPAEIITEADFRLPTEAALNSIKNLDLQIHYHLRIQEIDVASDYFYDFIQSLCQLMSDDDYSRVHRKMYRQIFIAQFNSISHSQYYTVPLESGVDTYTSSEAAEILNVSDQTIRRWCEKGKFVHAEKTDGGHWRIPKTNFKISLEQAIKRKEVGAKLDRIQQEDGESLDESEYI